MENLRYNIDLEQFWKDNELALMDNCFNKDAPQVAFGLNLQDENVFAELDVPGEPTGDNPPDLLREYRKRYNDKAERIIGKRILSEGPFARELYPRIKQHGEIFGGRYIKVSGSYWLESDIKTAKQLDTMLDNVEKLDLREFILPANWEQEQKRIYEETGIPFDPSVYGRHVRGPVTLAMSIYGVENTIFLMYEEPQLAHRFFNIIEDVFIDYIKLMDEISGECIVKSKSWGFKFYDDNCCMLNLELYEEYAYPILKQVFEYACPALPKDERYQHSDSAMAHLLPILGKLHFTGVNFGPTVLLDEIRKYMPNTRVDGCLDPMILMKNDEEAVIAQVRRDCEVAKALGTKGLKIDAAGSVNNGTLLTTVRAAMWAIQEYGRY